MNNEERILAMLEQMNGRLDRMEARIEIMNANIASLKERKIAMNIDFIQLSDILNVVKQSQIRAELELYPQIAAALEGLQVKNKEG